MKFYKFYKFLIPNKNMLLSQNIRTFITQTSFKLKNKLDLKEILNFKYRVEKIDSLILIEENIKYLSDQYGIEKFILIDENLKKFKNEICHINEYLKFLNEEDKIKMNNNLQQNIQDYNLLDLLAFYINSKFPQKLKNYRFIKNIIDLNNPENWYPEARSIKRKVYYHMGPTNSGKTSHAIKSLINSRTGIYCAPLRLLAWEVQEKLISNKVLCNLITGQEKLTLENATHISCTVEKSDTMNNFECAVIDEIQMINDNFRGNAWTEAFLGIQAKEIHLCGDPRALKLITELCLLTGDNLIKKSYNRLGRLEVESKPLINFKELRQGDCVIGFSKKKLLNIRKSITEQQSSCAVIYGHLPPKTKKEQINLFNLESSQVKYLCATDAIGLGLNLNIKRIIFSSLEKNIDGKKINISSHEIKQIAGRAGRAKNIGYVTAFEEKDLHIIRNSLIGVNDSVGKTEDHATEAINIIIDNKLNLNQVQFSEQECEIHKAIVFPPLQTLLDFASIYMKVCEIQNMSFSETIKLFKNFSNVRNKYIFKDLSKLLIIIENLECELKYDLKTLYYFMNAPIRLSEITKHYHRLYLRDLIVNGIVKVPAGFRINIDEVKNKKVDVKYLQYLEDVYNCIEIYIFLSFRFEKNFIERSIGEDLKNQIAEIIEFIIEENNILNLTNTSLKRGNNFSKNEYL